MKIGLWLLLTLSLAAKANIDELLIIGVDCDDYEQVVQSKGAVKRPDSWPDFRFYQVTHLGYDSLLAAKCDGNKIVGVGIETLHGTNKSGALSQYNEIVGHLSARLTSAREHKQSGTLTENPEHRQYHHWLTNSNQLYDVDVGMDGIERGWTVRLTLLAHKGG